MPVSAPAPSSSSSTCGVERRRLPVAEVRRPDRHRGAVLDLARLADHAAGAAADQRAGRQRLVDRLERRLGRREVRAGGEHDREVAARRPPGRSRARRAPPRRAPARGSGLVRQAGADADGHAQTTILRACLQRRRRLRAHRRGQDRGRDRAGRAAARRGEDPVAVSADALQVYAGWRSSPARRPPREQRAARAPAGRRSAVDGAVSAPAPTPGARTPRSTRCSRDGRRPIVVGGTGLYLRAALAELDLRPPVRPGDPRRAPPPARRTRRRRAARRARARAPDAAAAIRPTDAPARHPRARAARRRPRAARRASSCGPPTPATRRCSPALTMEREALYARIDARVDAMVAAGAADEVRARRRGRRVAHRPQGARLRRAARRRRRGDEDRSTRRYAKRQLTWMRKLPGAHLDRRHRTATPTTSPPSCTA